MNPPAVGTVTMSGMAAERSTPSSTSPSLRLRFNQFELDEADARLTRGGQPVPLAPKPFAVLCALARTPRALVTKNALLDSVWGHRFVTESVLKSTISELRAALEDDAKQPRYIETVSRRGYRFIAAVNAPAAALPAIPAQSAWSTMIGRAQPLERLRRAWQLAAGGRRQVVWIAGEAGVGKTTLVERFIAEVGDTHCIHGQCVEQYGSGEPYLPVLEALTALCHRDQAAAELIRSVAPTWLLQLPWLSSAAERETLWRDLAGGGPARMLREMGQFLDRYTDNHPLVLVTVDLHWSDQATVQLMDYIARRRSATRLLWLASFRLTEIIAANHPLHAVRNELRLHGLADEIVLDAFSEREVAEYVAARLPAQANDEAFVRALHGRTDGLPLFVADVVNEVAERGELPGAIAIPRSLAGVIERYIGQLAAADRTLLEAASVCGAEFRLATVAHVLERDAASLAQSCTELARQHRWLTEVDERYVFRHALFREVLYKSIAPLARVELHRKVAAALESERADGRAVRAAELASHFELAGEPMPAVRYYAEAAESALLHFSPAEAMTLTERAMALLPPKANDGTHAALQVTLATLRGTAATQLQGIGSSEAKRAFQEALSLLDRVPRHPMRALFLNALGVALIMRGEVGEASAVADRAAALSEARADQAAMASACVTHGLAQHLSGRPRIARQWFQRGLAAVQRLDERTSRTVFLIDPGVLTLGLFAVDLAHLGLVDQGRERMRAAFARAQALGGPGPLHVVLWAQARFELRMGNARGVVEAVERLGALMDEYELPQGRAAHTWFHGWMQAHLGDPRMGHRLIHEGCEHALRIGVRATASETLGYAAEALALAGEWSAARREVEEAMQCADAMGERVYLTQLHLLAARIADALGEPDRARESMLRALAEARAQQAPWLEMLALSALCERAEATPEDRASLRAVLDRITGAEDTAPVARARALLA
jgi:DNA-binding winged helix-turn-helix (wHTH) protein/tetratricopeptide (TPR) repeat protein